MNLKTITVRIMMVTAFVTLIVGTLSAQGNVKKSDYRRILNDFCNAEFEGCFEGLMYLDKTLTVLDVVSNTKSNRALIKGRLGYVDYNGKKHYAVKYEAEVETYGTEVQKIQFGLECPADRTHTKPYFISCTRLMGQRQREADKAETQRQEILYYTQLLDEFCVANYNKCFSGRSYEENSIIVTHINTDNNTGVVTVEGTHTYVGRTGTSYRDYKFMAKIREGRNGTRIEFHKESAADLMHSSTYWEDCTKTF